MPDRVNMLPKVILPTASFTPATFQGVTFTPQQADMSLLARSLDKVEQREEKLSAQRLALSEAFSKARELLPDNEETNRYITENQERISKNIDTMAGIGDMSNALQSARTLAGDFISSPEYNARVKHHKQRNAWLEELKRSNVDNNVKEYYEDIYTDTPEFTRDVNGAITGAQEFKAPLPEQGQSATAIIQMAVKATADERTDTSSSHSGSGGGSSSAYRRELLTADKISQTAKSIVNSDTRVRQAFIDQFNAGIHKINKLERQKNELNNQLAITTDENKRRDLENRIASIENQASGYKSSFYKNSAPIANAEAYIDNLFSANNEEIKNASYDYQHSSSSSHSGSAGGGGGAGAADGGLGALLSGLPSTQDLIEIDVKTKTGNVHIKPQQNNMPQHGRRPEQKTEYKPSVPLTKTNKIVDTPW